MSPITLITELKSRMNMLMDGGKNAMMIRILREVELICTLFVSIASANNHTGLACALISYAHGHTAQPLSSVLYERMSHFKDAVWQNRVYELIKQSDLEEVNWLNSFKKIYSEFRLYGSSNIYKSVTNLINYIVSLGLCEATNLTFNVGSLEAFAPVAIKGQITALSFVDAIVNTVVAFVEGGYRVYTTGQISSFFFCSNSILSFEKKFSLCAEYAGYISTGNLFVMKGVKDDDYLTMLETTITTGEALLADQISKKDKTERIILDRKLTSLRVWKADFEQSRVRGDVRESPFALSFYGDSSVGKTSLTVVSINAIGKFNDIDVSAEKRQIWNDSDKFASNVRSSTNVIMFDDFSNTKSNFTPDGSPCLRLIQCINNALFLAPMAEAHMKGKVALRPKIVTITTNVEHLNAPVYSNKPESVLRRMYHVKVDLKPRYRTSSGTLNEDAVLDDYPGMAVPNIWVLSVRECKIKKGTDNTPSSYSLEEIKYASDTGEILLKNVSVDVYMQWLQDTSSAHFRRQKLIVETLKPKLDIEPCLVCKRFYCYEHEKVVDVCNASATEAVDILHDLKVLTSTEESTSAINEMQSLSAHAGIPKKGLLLDKYAKGVAKLLELGGIASINTTSFDEACAAGGVVQRAYHRQRLDIYNFCLENFESIAAGLERYTELTTEKLTEKYLMLQGEWFDWFCYVPEHWYQSKTIQYLYLYMRGSPTIFVGLYLFLTCSFIVLIWAASHLNSSVALLFFSIYFINSYLAFCYLLHLEKDRVLRELSKRAERAPVLLKYLRAHYSQVLLGSGALLILFKLLKSYRMGRTFFEQHGNLSPSSMDDILIRNKEVNVWAQAHTEPIPLTIKSLTTTSDQLVGLCARNTYYVKSEFGHVTHAFCVMTNMVIVPKHFIQDSMVARDSFRVTVFTGPPEQTGNSFECLIGTHMCVPIGDHDAVIVHMPKIGSKKNLIEYFPEKTIDAPLRCKFVVVRPDKRWTEEIIRFTPGRGPYGSRFYNGGSYDLQNPTEIGMCMSPIVSFEKGSYIVGLHIAGITGKTKGAAVTLTRGELDSALDVIFTKPSVMRLADETTMENEHFGKTIVVQSGKVKPSSSVNYLDVQNCHVTVFGESSERSTPHSSVITSVISPSIEKYCGCPQLWGPPKMRGPGCYPYQVALNKYAHQSLEIGPELDKAIQCYKQCFTTIKSTGDLYKLYELLRPLDDIEIVSGRDGERFIDSMKMQSSPGFPFSKNKLDLIEVVTDEDIPEITKRFSAPRRFIKVVREEIAKCETKLAARERVYVPWKSSLKDEATKLTKTKVRVFQCAPIVLQAIIRKYYMPIAQLMQYNAISTECAVGCNAVGEEWYQLYSYMMKWPNKFGGDYSDYDQRMPAQLIIAAFKILIGVARMSEHYTEEHITIMESVVSEIVTPIVIYDGSVVQLYGSNPSGQNLTVVINSLVNSLLMRCAYYSIYPKQKPGDFRKFVHIITYGDDVLGSVANERRDFNIQNVAAYLKRCDIIFTNPNKTISEAEFLEPDECDFLKRKNYYNAELGINVGLLDDASIFKRLHCHLESKDMHKDSQSAVNIDTSLADWAWGPREVYEMRLEQLTQVAKEHQLDMMCNGLISYDVRVERWRADNPNSKRQEPL